MQCGRRTFDFIFAQWRGLGGDEDAHYIHWEHDYRDMATKQTSLLYLDRGASGGLKEDRMTSDYWLRLVDSVNTFEVVIYTLLFLVATITIP